MIKARPILKERVFQTVVDKILIKTDSPSLPMLAHHSSFALNPLTSVAQQLENKKMTNPFSKSSHSPFPPNIRTSKNYEVASLKQDLMN